MSKSAALRVLAIPELAELILLFTCTPESTRSAVWGLTTLVTMARVNKFLSEIALTYIWTVMDTPYHLISLVNPRLIAHIRNPHPAQRKPKRGKTYVSKARDLATYVRYSKFVKHMLLEDEPRENVLVLETMDYLVANFGWNGLHFNNLEHLGMRPAHFTDWALYFTLRSGLRIESLSFTLDSHILNYEAFELVGRQCPNLKALKLAPTPTTQEMFQRFVRPALKHMPNLERIQFHLDADAVADVLLSLRQRPKLEDVHLVIRRGIVINNLIEDDLLPRREVEMPLKFRCLTNDAANIPMVLTMSAAIALCYDAVEILNTFQLNGREVAEMLRSLSIYHSEAHSVSIQDQILPCMTSISGIGALDEEFHAISSATLLHLTKLRNLKDVNIDTCGTAMVTPGLLDAIASSCPHLRLCMLSPYRLSVSNEHMKAGEFLVTIQDVVVFLGRCHNLVHAGIAFDGRRSIGEEEIVFSMTTSPVEVLHIGGSAIDNVEYVGKLLVTLPRLERLQFIPSDYVHHTYLPTPDEMDMWGEVNDDYLLCHL